MIVLQASHISKQFDGTDVLLDASVVVQTGDRVALIGHNGAGKSTLLRVLTGEVLADSGEVHVARETSVGYVSQFISAEPKSSVYAYVREVFSSLLEMEAQIRSLESHMADPNVYENERRFKEVSSKYAALVESFEASGGYAADAKVRRVLDGMQFPPHMHNQSIESLSGGQKTRLSLARLLAWQPDVLIMDEPTNYLDTKTLTWLEDYLKTYAGALVLVSHDRYFLDAVATSIVELEAGRTKAFVGNYSAYVDAKSIQLEVEQKRFEAQQQEIARLDAFVEKNIVRASTTKRAQSRRKLLEKLVRFEKPSTSVRKIALSFSTNRTSGKDVLQINNLSIGFPQKVLFSGFNMYVSRGQRVAMIGPNGIGKTTLLTTLIGRRPPLAGTVQWGTHVDLGYYDQEQAGLNMHKTVLSQIWDEYPDFDTTTIRTALGRFLFRGEDVEKPVQGLSGGERSRLNLCRLMLQGANVLVLDEPTNHLDLLAKEVLEDALENYEGTILFVSHDRYFIDAIATHIALIDETGLHIYIGNYTEYLLKRKEEERLAAEQAEREVSESSEAGSRNRSLQNATMESSTTRVARTRIRSSDLRKAKQKVLDLEAEMARLETKQNEIAQAQSEAAMRQDVTRLRVLQEEVEQTEQALTHTLSAWEQAVIEVETLEDGQP